MKTILKRIVILLLFITSFTTSAQQILLDKPIRAGELTLFPELDENLKMGNNYYYMPDKPRLALHKDNTPHFSFLRYVKNEKTAANLNTAISESSYGGGIVHVVVELKVTDKQIKDAQRSLRRINAKGKIVGPIVFKSGRVSLISSFAKPGGEFTKQVVGIGNAPILENQRAAISVQLNKLGSKILWESFKTTTPDFSIYFEMDMLGYQSPKRVKIEADLASMYKHQTFEAGIASPVFGGEIDIAMKELEKSRIIKVTQIGDDEELNKLKKVAYDHLTNLLSNKVGNASLIQPNSKNKKSALDRATAMLEKSTKEKKAENKRIENAAQKKAKKSSKSKTKAVSKASKKRKSKKRATIKAPKGKQKKGVVSKSSSTGKKTATKTTKSEVPKKVAMPGVAIMASYQLKKIKEKGTYRVDLNKYTQTTRAQHFTYNMGSVRNSCSKCFKEVNLDDDLMKQREINASLGGVVSDDFKYINFVNVLMRKKHQDGTETIDEIKIDKSAFNTTGNFFKMMYGWKGDTDRDKWLSYEYKTLWSVFGDHTFESDWIKTNFGSISLEPPIVKKPIYIEVDKDFITKENIKAVEVKIYTEIKGAVEVYSANLKTLKGELSKTMEVVLPREIDAYQYVITYFIKGKPPVSSSKQKSNYGRIDLDRFYK